MTILMMANNWGLICKKIFCMCLNFCNLFPELYLDFATSYRAKNSLWRCNHNSYAFVQFILVFTISCFTLVLLVKTGLIFIFLKTFSNLDFLHNISNSFSNILPICCLNGSKDPGNIRFNCSEESFAWKRRKIKNKQKNLENFFGFSYVFSCW